MVDREVEEIIVNGLLDKDIIFDSCTEKLVYFVLKSFESTKSTAEDFPSIKMIARACLLAESTVRRTLQKLTQRGFIKTVHRVSQTKGNETNAYIFVDFDELRKHQQLTSDVGCKTVKNNNPGGYEDKVNESLASVESAEPTDIVTIGGRKREEVTDTLTIESRES